MKMPFNFINNRYTKNRGAPALLELGCIECGAYVMSYQKDGPGPLLRCYLDRIHYPEELHMRQFISLDKNSTEHLKCKDCDTVIGSPMLYKKENRLAYCLRPGFFWLKKVY